MWNQGEESVAGVQELALSARSVPDHVLHLGEDLVGSLDLLLAQLAQRHLGQVDLEFQHRTFHSFNVEDQGDQLLIKVWFKGMSDDSLKPTHLDSLGQFGFAVLG